MSKVLISKDSLSKKSTPLREKKPKKQSSNKGLLIAIIIILILLIVAISAVFLLPVIKAQFFKEQPKTEEKKEEEKKEEKEEESSTQNQENTNTNGSSEGTSGGSSSSGETTELENECEIVGELSVRETTCQYCRCIENHTYECMDVPGCCMYHGVGHGNGTSFTAIDGCNTCTCNNGRVTCTLRLCP